MATDAGSSRARCCVTVPSECRWRASFSTLHGGLTGWYLRPKIPTELLSWLCPVELRLRASPAWQSEPGDEVIWMISD